MGTYLYSFAQRKARRRGAALVEFGLIAILFFTMLLGMIQFGMYQSTTNTLWNLSREGARFASVSKPTDDAIRTKVRGVAPPNIDVNKLTIDIYPTERKSGDPVAVCLTYDMRSKLIFPGFRRLFNRTRNIPAQPPQPAVVVTGYNYFTSSIMRVE